MRQGVKPLGEPAEDMKHEPRALNTSSAQGHTPARKHAPGYANSQQKSRELVQAGMTPKNRIQAHAGGNVPQSD